MPVCRVPLVWMASGTRLSPSGFAGAQQFVEQWLAQ